MQMRVEGESAAVLSQNSRKGPLADLANGLLVAALESEEVEAFLGRSLPMILSATAADSVGVVRLEGASAVLRETWT